MWDYEKTKQEKKKCFGGEDKKGLLL